MCAAIRDDGPVLFFEHKALYHAGKSEVDTSAEPGHLGKAVVAKEGTDLSIYASALMTKRALQAAQDLAADGISAEVIDLRTISASLPQS